GRVYPDKAGLWRLVGGAKRTIRISLVPSGIDPTGSTLPRQRMFAKAAFGAIAGTIVGLLLDPLLDAIPPIPILTGFVDSLASEILTIALTAAGALISTKVQRLDHFIAEHASRIAVTTSLL